jgi:hypothetical protein
LLFLDYFSYMGTGRLKSAFAGLDDDDDDDDD